MNQQLHNIRRPTYESENLVLQSTTNHSTRLFRLKFVFWANELGDIAWKSELAPEDINIPFPALFIHFTGSEHVRDNRGAVLVYQARTWKEQVADWFGNPCQQLFLMVVNVLRIVSPIVSS